MNQTIHAATRRKITRTIANALIVTVDSSWENFGGSEKTCVVLVCNM